MNTVKQRTINQAQSSAKIAECESFMSGNLWSENVLGATSSWGQIPDRYRDIIRKIFQDTDEPVYVVYSYYTPIAVSWVDKFGDRQYLIPRERYSQTTSQHQSSVRHAWRGFNTTEV